MTKLSYRDLLRWASHPSEEELLSYLDQQLRARKAGCIRRHLEGCWRCRGKQEEIERSISGIVKNLNGLLGDSAGYPAQAQPRFEDRASDRTSSTVSQSLRLAVQKSHPNSISH